MMTGSIAVQLLHCLQNQPQRPNESPNEIHDPTNDVAYHEPSLTQVPKIVKLLPKSMVSKRIRKTSKTILPASPGN